jgi:hypothetical protein
LYALIPEMVVVSVETGSVITYCSLRAYTQLTHTSPT